MTTQSECQKGIISLQLQGMMIFMVKKLSHRNTVVNCNSNNGAINRVDVIPSGNKISSGKQTAWKEEYH